MTYPRLMMALCAVGLIAGCATTTDPCAWAQPIRPGRADVLTQGTARQILSHNEAGASICGWRP